MPEELLPILTSFYREVMLPDMQRMIDGAEARINTRFDDVTSHFDAIYQRFDRLEKSLSSRPALTISSGG